MPTETVYGLAADADNDAAVAQIFKAKGRPSGHPLIVHLANRQAAEHYACNIPDFARALMAAFWPGPLTLILPRRPGIASAAAGGHPTIGLRCPDHPVALALLNWGQSRIHFFGGLAAPSANLFGRVSPTTAAHVQAEFGDALLVLDGGACRIGIESSIVDCTRGPPVLLRPGAISPAQMAAACGLRVLQKNELSALAAPAPSASGTLASHYAPRARVRVMAGADLQRALAAMPAPATRPMLAVWSRSAMHAAIEGVWQRAMPETACGAAQQLFAQLRAFDALGVSEIWIETPPADPAWDGVRDRLQRAAH